MIFLHFFGSNLLPDLKIEHMMWDRENSENNQITIECPINKGSKHWKLKNDWAKHILEKIKDLIDMSASKSQVMDHNCWDVPRHLMMELCLDGQSLKRGKRSLFKG